MVLRRRPLKDQQLCDRVRQEASVVAGGVGVSDDDQ